jgi:hypothetical protein
VPSLRFSAAPAVHQLIPPLVSFLSPVQGSTPSFGLASVSVVRGVLVLRLSGALSGPFLCFGSLRLVRSSYFSAVGWSVLNRRFRLCHLLRASLLLFCLALQSCVRFSSTSDAPCTQESQVPSWLSSLLSSLWFRIQPNSVYRQ